MWQSLNGISMAMASCVGLFSTSVIWRGLWEWLARMLRQFGQAQIHWPQAFTKWVLQHSTTPLMTIGMGGISVKLSNLYVLFYCLLFIVSLSIYLGLLLLKHFNKAIDMSAKQINIFSQLSATFSSETINKWEALVTNWNTHSKAPNPYQEPTNSMWRLSDIFHFHNQYCYRSNFAGCSPLVHEGRSCSSHPWQHSTT